MARQLVGAMIAALLAGGCGKQLNSTFCAAPENANDPDCRAAGFVDIDGPVAACNDDSMCVNHADGNVCDLGSHTCVQCVPGGNISACVGTATPVCGGDRLCHGCIVDTDCPDSRVCLPAGVCAIESAVLYAQPMPLAPGAACTLASPCSLTEAIAGLSTTRSIVKLTTTFSGNEYSAPAISILISATIIGTGTKFTPTNDADAISVTGGRLEVFGLAILNSERTGVSCVGGELTLRRMSVTNSNEYGVQTTNCRVLIEGSRFTGNPSGALLLNTGMIEARNNIIDKNGTTQLDQGNVVIANATGYFTFNTIADNLSRSGGNRISGINCTGPAFQVKRNILAGNGDAPLIRTGNCIFDGNIELDTSAEVLFDPNRPYHLTPMTPKTNPIIRDDPDALADCTPGGKYIDDFDGEARPIDYCDRGADEYRP